MNGAWLAFIGLFLNTAAARGNRQVELQTALQDVPVARVMRRDVPTLAPDLTVRALVDEWMRGGPERAYPVMEGSRLVGLVTPEDVRRLERGRWEGARVGDVMTPAERLEVVEPEASAFEALRVLLTRNVPQLPVLLNGRLEGMVRRADILRWTELPSQLAR